jgi:hypothetical protein
MCAWPRSAHWDAVLRLPRGTVDINVVTTHHGLRGKSPNDKGITDKMRRLAYFFVLLFLALLPFLAPAAKAQGTFTAASCNRSDVSAVINGPIHAAVNGDVIQIPAGSCSWTTGITVSAGIGITIIGSGTPSSSTSTFLPDSSCTATQITDKLSSGALITMSPHDGNSLTRLSCMELIPYTPTTGYGNPVVISGTCTSSGCPNLRMDNMTVPSGWGTGVVADGTFAVVNNMFGVADHDDLDGGVLANVGHGSWQGVGNYGDNSWAQPDSFGTAQAFYLENNTFNNGGGGTDTDSGTNGGGRFVCRFNQVNAGNSVCYIHGTDTGQRLRGGRQEESYGNSLNSCNGGVCDTVFEFRSGVGRVFGNTVNTANAYINSFAKLDAQRSWRQDTPWGSCDGSSVWDTNDRVTYFSGTIGAVSGIGTGNWTITGSPGWTTNEWAPAGAPYAFHDVTQKYGITVSSSASNSLSLIPVNEGNVSFRPVAGDSYEILRATVCIDQPTRSGGNLVQNNGSGSPVLASTGNAGAVSESLDPTYEWDDSGLPSGKTAIGSTEPFMIANRDYYSETNGQTEQTSPTSPFNGTSGTGWGTLAYRPTACTSGVGYFATDQGNWNQSGNGFGQGELFTCATTNNWTLDYTPYSYPHPLTAGNGGTGGNSVAAPTNVTATVQ